MPACCNVMTSVSQACRGEAASCQTRRGCASGLQLSGREGLSGLFFRIMTDTPGHLLLGPAVATPSKQGVCWVARLARFWDTGNPLMVVPQLVGKASLQGNGSFWKEHWPWSHQTWNDIKALSLSAWLTWFSSSWDFCEYRMRGYACTCSETHKTPCDVSTNPWFDAFTLSLWDTSLGCVSVGGKRVLYQPLGLGFFSFSPPPPDSSSLPPPILWLLILTFLFSACQEDCVQLRWSEAVLYPVLH